MKQKIVKGFKSVTSDLKSGHGGIVWRVGEWQKHDGDLKMCECGFVTVNVSLLAEACGVSQNTIVKQLKKHPIEITVKYKEEDNKNGGRNL